MLAWLHPQNTMQCTPLCHGCISAESWIGLGSKFILPCKALSGNRSGWILTKGSHSLEDPLQANFLSSSLLVTWVNEGHIPIPLQILIFPWINESFPLGGGEKKLYLHCHQTWVGMSRALPQVASYLVPPITFTLKKHLTQTLERWYFKDLFNF